MANGEGQVSVAFSDSATASYRRLPPEHRAVVDARLRALALEPESAPLRALSAAGRKVFIAQVVVDDRGVKGCRIDFALDEAMQARAGIPAIAVRRIKTMRR
jgi:hypothetical protein